MRNLKCPKCGHRKYKVVLKSEGVVLQFRCRSCKTLTTVEGVTNDHIETARNRRISKRCEKCGSDGSDSPAGLIPANIKEVPNGTQQEVILCYKCYGDLVRNSLYIQVGK